VNLILKKDQQIIFVLVCSNVAFMAQTGTSFTAADRCYTEPSAPIVTLQDQYT